MEIGECMQTTGLPKLQNILSITNLFKNDKYTNIILAIHQIETLIPLHKKCLLFSILKSSQNDYLYH